MSLRILLLVPFALAGCAGSRWAKDDPDYAAKYPSHTDNWARTIKQAVDARHLSRKGGGYVALTGPDDPFALGGEAGIFKYPNPYTEGRVGLAGLIYEEDTPISGGVLAAARVQTPTRVAPFVGIGAYAGMTPETWLTDDNIDNDFDGSTDEADEADSDFAFAMIPEVGCHFWLTPGWRLTGSASYYITDAGRDGDFLTFGVSLACLTDLGIVTNPKTLLKQSHDRGWQIGDGDGDLPADPPKRVIYVDSDPLSFLTADSPATADAMQSNDGIPATTPL